MKKLLYISFEDSHDKSSGVNKKIWNQIHVFKEAGLQVTKIARHNNGIMISNDDEEEIVKGCNRKSKELVRILLCNYIINIKDKYDICYIRFQFFCPYVKSMIKHLNKMGTKIIVEIPTYPYEQELKAQGMKGMIKLTIDRIYRYPCSKYIDRFAVVLRDEPLYNVNCLNIKNGINVSEIKKRVFNKTEENESINFIAVALMAPWHGYDRFIKGIHTYYKNGGVRSIKFHLVGEGVESPVYKKIVSEYNLAEKVVFHGKLSGSRLDEIYNNSDIGVSVLAGFRKNLVKESNLKSVEYCAKGLPVVCTNADTTFDISYLYKYLVPSDETEINISDVIKFYDTVISNKDREKIDEDIRNYAIINCDIRNTFNNVIEYIVSHN